jgi:molybdopterin biosynthesis enzyme MoaB
VIKIITLSDRASKGIYEDASGNKMAEMLEKYFHNMHQDFSIHKQIIPDEASLLRASVLEAKQHPYDLIFTSGGT